MFNFIERTLSGPFCHSQKESTLFTDSLGQIKETLGQFLTGLPRFLLKWCFLQRITKTL